MDSDRITVRWAEPKDKPGVARLLRGLIVYTGALYGRPECEMKTLETVLADLDRTLGGPNNIRFVVADRDGEVAGICAVETSYSTWHAKPYIVVNDVFVDPECRRMKLGTKLLQFVADHAREIGCCRVDLFVEEANHGARRLYETFGFTQLKQASYSLPIQPCEELP